ncbi:MAG TPA: ABC transporter substrate-binding protein, partial [Stellaceae bacterium]|nr:ABC transporter substrate-binding protein [Stellaceae bacterium]
MSRITRRTVLEGGLAAAAVAAAPAIARAQGKPSVAQTVRAVLHGDIPTYDPIWTTANMSAYHGAMVYDTLFGIDGNQAPQPQMVGKYGVSDDKLTWTFELRDGLKWTDGTDVTTADVIPSLKRWAARDGGGQHMMLRVKDIAAKDAKTFQIILKEKYGLVLDVLAKTSTPICYMMRKKEAETDPMQKIDTVVGSGPFKMNPDETKPGTQYVYDKNAAYVPRSEPATGIAGGKIVKVERVVYINMPDAQTAMAALQAGEIDFYEIPPLDLLGGLEGDPNIKLEVLNKLGNVGQIRLNFLHPPFDNEKARQAMLYIVNQSDMMKASFGSSPYARTCGAYFGCGTPMENGVNDDWFKGGQNYDKAKQLFKEAGYDGRPILLMQATNIAIMSNTAQVLAQEMRQAGLNVQVEAMDWSNVVQRRSSKAAPDKGGWNIFITWSGGAAIGNPILLAAHAATGDNAWFGWPKNEQYEELRNQWALADTLEERKKIAEKLQQLAWTFVPQLYYGQWIQPAAMRKNINGVIPV